MSTGEPLTRVERLRAAVAEGRDLLQETRRSNADWPALVERESLLRERLTVLLAEPVSSSEAAAVRIALQELLTLNRQAVEAIEARQGQLAGELRHTALVRRAAQAYSHAATV